MPVPTLSTAALAILGPGHKSVLPASFFADLIREYRFGVVLAGPAGRENMMKHRIQFQMTVPVEVRHEGSWFYSSCPILDVHSQGTSHEEAINHLVEALRLFVESCYHRGTLDDVLKDCGFEPDGFDDDDDGGLTVSVPLALVARQLVSAAPG